ncbi:MAG TPA: 16S rRNA (adenine(1518)-N(6)/adenine(1519)-N(6))-dimethyltransferase RsmA [Thermoanaerobaculia bacterium]|nr:16S rRNA (adenine(1518)-N(6)/adenine(1519)-N(6))-dimethyltransferase RsmA [Thermoanaerobaculia bacterium]
MARPSHPPLRKHLGQHHLVDGALCRPLLDFLEPQGRRVLEVGPGGGVLTTQLLRSGAKVLAVELDPAWAFTLHRRLRVSPTFALAVADALELDWPSLPAPTLVAGNLPYNVATPILARVLPHHEQVPRAAFLVQKELAERLTARPGTQPYGSLSVLAAAYSEARILARVRPGSFRPPPKVESAFVGLTLHAPPLPPEEMPAFLATVRLAFGQRRKTLRNALGAGWGRAKAEDALATAGIDPGRRAEELSLAELLALYRAAAGGA